MKEDTVLQFVFPSETDRENVLSFYDEFKAHGGGCIGMADSGNFNRWLTGMQNRRTGTNLPAGYVRENFYLCYEQGALVGVFSLKFSLTDYLLNYGGHIGYAVRPSEQNRGLATRMLAEGCRLAGELGFARLLCVCDADNHASEHVILKNGGVPEDERYDPEERVTVKRYWINLPPDHGRNSHRI